MSQTGVRSNSILFTVLIYLSLFSISMIINGCEKKEEPKIEQSNQQNADTSKTGASIDTASNTVTEEPADIKGSYKGTFDSRSSTLKITELDGNKFKGSVSTMYREALNQQISGEFNPQTMEFSMKDQLHSRFQGKYFGKFSADLTSLSGTFTMNLNGSKYSFSYKKK